MDECQYIFFSNLCARYGFYISKNAPWRLVANVGSQRMTDYINRFREVEYPAGPQSLGRLFSNHYTETLFDDYFNLVDFLQVAYEEFVKASPFLVKPKYSDHRTKVCKTPRANPAEEFRKYNSEKYLKMYFKTRIAETPMTDKLSVAHVERLFRDVMVEGGEATHGQGLTDGHLYYLIRALDAIVVSFNRPLQIATKRPISLDKISYLYDN